MKKCYETSLQMTGNYFIAYFLTFSLVSSPKDKNSSPINCSQSWLPKHSLILLNNCTATNRLFSLVSSCDNSNTYLRIYSPLSFSFSFVANFDSSLAAYCLVCGYGELYIDVLLVQVLDGEGYDCIFYVVLDLCWFTVLLYISQYILKQTQ